MKTYMSGSGDFRFNVRFVALALIVFFWGQSAYLSANKIALIVTVGDYPEDSGWKKINSANDFELIHAALIRQGFESGNIYHLSDAGATRAGILEAIRTRLLERVRSGDVAYFHFSGHGQQVYDDNGDEVDGYDEAIVPYDSPIRFQAGVYEGKNLIRDDELGDLFNQIRGKLGPSGQMMVLLDACHSGTGTRGMSAARGTDRIMADSNYIANRVGSRGSSQAEHQFGGGGGAGQAPMVAFFGAAHSQLNHETHDAQGRKVGSLSFAFSKHFSQAGPSSTYRSLFDQIRMEMAALVPQQTPQAEGALDRALMGGAIVAQPAYFGVKELRSDGTLLLDAGWLQGLNDGSVVGFFPPDTRNLSKAVPLGKGVVSGSSPLHCVVTLESGAAESLRGSWVFLLEQQPGSLRVNLRMDLPEGPVRSALATRFGQTPVIGLEEPADLILHQEGDQLGLYSATEQLIAYFPVNMEPGRLGEQLLSEVKTAGQAKFLRGLSGSSSQFKLSMELIPVELDSRGFELRQLSLASFTDAGGTVRIPENTNIRIRVTNAGPLAAYFTLVDLQPDNQFNILIPAEGTQQTPEEFRVPAGESFLVPGAFQIGPPYGQEIMKLIATETPVDLRMIKASRGTQTRSMKSLTPLEQLFSDTFYSESVQTRGGRVQQLGADSMSVFSTSFLITKP